VLTLIQLANLSKLRRYPAYTLWFPEPSGQEGKGGDGGMRDFVGLVGKFGKSRWPRPQKAITVLALMLATAAISAPAAGATLGYEPASTPTFPLTPEGPHGVAIDQASQRIYVATLSTDILKGASGLVAQLESTGVPTAASPFTFGLESFPTGVAVDPLTQGVYVAQSIGAVPGGGTRGTSKILKFSSAGMLESQFSTTNVAGVGTQIATDSSGSIYFPSYGTNAVQVFNSAGLLQGTITCSGCTGGPFLGPASVAVDSLGNVYVVDIKSDRVVKFSHSGGSYSFSSVLQSGRDAVAVAVDPSTNSVFVGDLSDAEYHVVAYDSTGAQFDDFSGNLSRSELLGPTSAGQIAVNSTTHRLYVSEPGSNVLAVFDRVTINPPAVATNPASSVGQVSARLNAAVNPHFHATSNCALEYINDANFNSNGYADAISSPCSSLPIGTSKSIALSLPVSGLTPNTTYHYRVMAANSAGPAEGSDVIFSTLPVMPATVATEAALKVDQTTATLFGKVNPHGGSVSDCHFEYGAGLAYGTSVSCGTAVGAVTTDVTESRAIGGLAANATYHYRLVVTSNAGVVKGNDREFTTPGPEEEEEAGPPATPPVTQPVVPPVATPAKPLKCKKGFKKKKVRGKLKCVKVKRQTKRRSG
jgi:6-phosphogluconolactonase (cycloisomerase 2 family)